jgi:hypothetical protein
MYNINIYLIPNKKFIILNNKHYTYLYIYNNNNYLCVLLYKTKLIIIKSLNIIKLHLLFPNKNTQLISSILNNFLLNWNIIFYQKITFNGKGFKIKKKKNIIFFFFNKSHISILINYSTIIKKIQRNKLIFFYKNYNYFNTQFFNKLLNIKYINIYTKRGLRLNRQIVLKKKGKGGTQTS